MESPHSTRENQHYSPEDIPGPGPEKDRGRDRGLEREDWNLQNNLHHKNPPDCRISIPEEPSESPDSTRENQHLTPEQIRIILINRRRRMVSMSTSDTVR